MAAYNATQVPVAPAVKAGSRDGRRGTVKVLGFYDQVDVTPPAFGGVADVSQDGTGELFCAWESASDETTAATDIRYLLWWALVPDNPNPSLPPMLTTAPGENFVTITGLQPGEAYRVMVRAMDQASNVSPTSLTMDGTAGADFAPPQFTNPPQAYDVSMGNTARVLVTWAPTFDVYDHGSHTYSVYRQAAGDPFNFAASPLAAVQDTSSYLDTDVNFSSTYAYVVRATDRYGNQDTNTQTTEVTTRAPADGAPPTLNGDPTVQPLTSTTLEVSWPAATDDASLPAAVSYEVHVATRPAAPFNVRAVSAPGAGSVVVEGLRPGIMYYIRYRARDAAGNLSTSSAEVSLLTPGATLAERPTLGNLVPAAGQPLGRSTAVGFDITDTGQVRRVIVTVLLNGVEEVIHNGVGFRPGYAAGSTRQGVAGGWRFRVLRTGGWPASPTFSVYAFDDDGNEAP